MIRERERYYAPIIFFLDIISTFLSYGLSVYFYLRIIIAFDPGLTGLKIPVSPFLYWHNTLNVIPFLVGVFIFFFQFIYRKEYLQRNKTVDFILQTVFPCLVAVAIFFVLLFINPLFGVNFWFITTFVVFLWILLSINRIVILSLIRFLQNRGSFVRYILIIGTNTQAVQIANLFDSHPGWGIRVVGLLTYDTNEIGKNVFNYNVLGMVDDLMFVLEKNVIDFVFLAQASDRVTQLQNVSLRCRTVGIDFIMDISILLQKMSKISVEYAEDSSFIIFKPVRHSNEMLFIKRLIDIVLSGILIILCAPLWIIVSFLIKRDSSGPVFFIQERVGKNGRLFPMYKFRSMVTGADKMQVHLTHLNEMDGPVFKIKDDPRLTRIGKFLRRTSLDELPQLFNVLMGNMSLVGPRPPILKEVLLYHPWQRKRLSVTPGVTCLWQVTGRNEIKFDEWMKLDMQYIDNWSLLLDIKILFMTIKAVISRRGAL
ncbi:MAG: sugar transferase [Proteobacteria bacterium]|nr:sugar transferase [Pseudomonadota bacterium]